jgi:site-specific recombinase XerC
MTTLASTVQAFFTDYLTRQRRASPHTIAAYRDSLRLLLAFTTRQAGTQPSAKRGYPESPVLWRVGSRVGPSGRPG